VRRPEVGHPPAAGAAPREDHVPERDRPLRPAQHGPGDRGPGASLVSATSEPATGARDKELVVCPVEEFPEGTKRILPVGRYGIGVYNVKGAYYAIANHCPHEGGPLCQGRQGGRTI